MRWSKTKFLLESLICENLVKRVKIHLTSYNASIGEPRRIWITLDNTEIFNASTQYYLIEHDKLWENVKLMTDKPFPECLYECYPEFVGKFSDQDYSMLVLEQRNVFNVDRVYSALVQYPNLSIDEAICSDNVIVQALAMIDKRLGKRRLHNIRFAPDTHHLIKGFYTIRCDAEGNHSLSI
ncbi:hypothetical protein QE429_003357 [Bacillus sp. SORGH_AS 510]|uniref:SF0329 family protein n=1 Tax=Bacillus sp. SORGH_AS_0510 TaxID=3041771 RepID=UPI00277FC511|nr:hypothetical protein [Bacillus sp. SORGH_AS_0510]MDQ1146530.1 hypothetical protein [Bacillus sp. SORGH_AS_0510]